MSVVIPLHTSSAGNIPIQLQPYINIRQWNTIILNLNVIILPFINAVEITDDMYLLHIGRRTEW